MHSYQEIYSNIEVILASNGLCMCMWWEVLTRNCFVKRELAFEMHRLVPQGHQRTAVQTELPVLSVEKSKEMKSQQMAHKLLG